MPRRSPFCSDGSASRGTDPEFPSRNPRRRQTGDDTRHKDVKSSSAVSPPKLCHITHTASQTCCFTGLHHVPTQPLISWKSHKLALRPQTNWPSASRGQQSPHKPPSLPTGANCCCHSPRWFSLACVKIIIIITIILIRKAAKASPDCPVRAAAA